MEKLQQVMIAALVALAFSALVSASAPSLAGTWDDTICNLLPLSSNIYRQRKIEFGSTSESLPSKQVDGTWKETTNYYIGNQCNSNELSYTVILSGTYLIGASASLKNFYNVDYRLNTKLFIAYNEATVSFIQSLTACSLSNLIPNVYYPINHTDCSALYLLPIEKCPVLHSIYSISGSTLWVGNNFPGNPPYWQPPCGATRPSSYDPYSLTKYQTVKTAIANYNFQEGFLHFYSNTLGVTSQDILVLGARGHVAPNAAPLLGAPLLLLLVCLLL